MLECYENDWLLDEEIDFTVILMISFLFSVICLFTNKQKLIKKRFVWIFKCFFFGRAMLSKKNNENARSKKEENDMLSTVMKMIERQDELNLILINELKSLRAEISKNNNALGAGVNKSEVPDEKDVGVMMRVVNEPKEVDKNEVVIKKKD